MQLCRQRHVLLFACLHRLCHLRTGDSLAFVVSLVGGIADIPALAVYISPPFRRLESSSPAHLFSSLPKRWLCLHGDGLVYHFYVFLSCICLFIYMYVAFRCHPPFLLRHPSANLGESDGPRQWLLHTCTTTLVCEVPWRAFEACEYPQMAISRSSNQINSVPVTWSVVGKGCMYLLSSRCPPRSTRSTSVSKQEEKHKHSTRSALGHKLATIQSCSPSPLLSLNTGGPSIWRWAGDYLFLYIYMVRYLCSWL